MHECVEIFLTIRRCNVQSIGEWTVIEMDDGIVDRRLVDMDGIWSDCGKSLSIGGIVRTND